MAKSPSEQIRELALEARGLIERSAARDREFADLADSVDELERWVKQLQIDNAARKQQLADHLVHYLEGDRRRWSLIVLLFGAVRSLASGLIVTLARK